MIERMTFGSIISMSNGSVTTRIAVRPSERISMCFLLRVVDSSFLTSSAPLALV